MIEGKKPFTPTWTEDVLHIVIILALIVFFVGGGF